MYIHRYVHTIYNTNIYTMLMNKYVTQKDFTETISIHPDILIQTCICMYIHVYK